MDVTDLELSGVAVVTGPGGVEFSHCRGLADRAAGVDNSLRTRFALASVTKMFTAVAIARTVADLHAPVAGLLPPERRPATLHPDVSVHHLLTHTSGIADYAEEDGDEAVEYADLWIERPCYSMTRPADFLPLFGDLPPYTPPGQGWRYSNAGYVLLGMIVEELTGESHVDSVDRLVFRSAGMDGSGFFRLDEPRPDLAVGYLPSGRTNIYSTPVIGGADGGAFATAGDLDRFLRAYGELVADRLPLMLTPHVRLTDSIDMGYGAFLYPDGRFGHGGGDPGVSTLIQRLPGPDATVVVLANTEDSEVVAIRDRLVEGILG
jgi:CubicO group peptidase (beta-lactamase class C family)